LSNGLGSIQSAAGGAGSVVDDLIGTPQDRNQAAKDAADLQQKYAETTHQIERQHLQAQRGEEQAFSQQVRQEQAARVDAQRKATQELRDIETQRRQTALDTENQLHDLAEQRGQVQQDLAQKAQQAESQWLSTSRSNLQQQAQLRSELQRTTAEAAQQWQQANADNLAQQRDIQQQLQATLHGSAIDFHRSSADNALQQQRIKEDLARTLADPGVSASDKQTAIIDAQRQLQDLQTDQDRAQKDYARQRKQERDDAKKQEKDLEDQRKQAEEDFHKQQQQDAASTASQIKDLEKQRLAAEDQFHQTQQQNQKDAADQLSALDKKQQDILDTQAQKYQDLEKKKQLALRDTAREQQVLARESAQAEQKYARDTAQEQQKYARETAQAKKQYDNDASDLAVQNQSALKKALDDGRITQQQYNDAVSAGQQIQQDRAAIDEDIAVIQAKQLPDAASLTADLKTRSDTLAAMNPEEQKRALYLADQATQTKILQVASLELAAAQNQIPKEVATKVIVDTAQADPDLANVLDQYNLIKQGADGTIKVNFPDGSEGKGTLDDATKQIDGLNKTEATATVKADATEFDKTIETSQTKADDFVSTYIAHLTADNHDFDLAIASAQGDADAFASNTYTTNLDASTTDFLESLLSAQTKGTLFEGTIYTAKLGGDYSFSSGGGGAAGGGSVDTSFFDAFNQAVGLGVAFRNATYTTKLGGDHTAFDTSLAEAQGEVDLWTRTTWVTTLDVAKAAQFDQHVQDITNNITTLITGGGGKDAPGGYLIPIDVNRSPLDQSIQDIIDQFDKQTIATAFVKVKAHGSGTTDQNADPGDVPSTGANRSGPVARAMGGFIASHRLVSVGEYGPELAILPSGSMVIPHGAAQSRLRAERARAMGASIGSSASTDVPIVIHGASSSASPVSNRTSGRSGGNVINIYGNPTFQLANANVADEVMRQTQTRNR
jgi:hypothetical protein